MMKHFWFTLLPLFGVLGFFGGCNTPSGIGDIFVDIVSYTPSSEAENEAQLTIRYSNHNIYAIAIKSASLKLYLNREYVGMARQHEPIGIPQVATGTRTVTLRIEKPAVIKKVLASPSPVVNYRLDTSLVAEVIDEKAEIKTSRSGQLDTAVFKMLPAEKKTVPDAPTK